MLQPVWLPALMHAFLLVRHRSWFSIQPLSPFVAVWQLHMSIWHHSMLGY